MSAQSAWPTRTRAIVALLAGMLLGGLLVWPALPRMLASLPSPDSLGSIGAVLIAGIFGLAVFTVGLFVLYFGLLSIETKLSGIW